MREIHKNIKDMPGWIARVITNRTGGTHVAVRRSDEPAPASFGWERPASRSEIVIEIEKREKMANEQAKAKAYRNRPEFAYADAVRNAIEFDSGDILDKLSVEEWRVFANRLK